ncbi:PEF-CTERM sorting domain-containing protein [Methanolobus chelungpuianus]|uniref:PEF-CTERM protein sorting domain-containing protein n=1 Tax=Methanolobus chelungpuianus TaxID=502115 RepID=A0AAE3H9A5_9EURY|nr:PEF-CTERM sorting domain-containing protein [Methanolobus chelungpuianus]MCQ6962310.1 hypothetical protein [Methanolobus chelungpuianus]
MRTKALIIAILIALASISAASAYSLDAPEDTILKVGNTVIYEVTVTGAASPSNFSVKIVDENFNDASEYFSLKVQGNNAAFGEKIYWEGTDIPFEVEITNNNAPVGYYQLEFENIATGARIAKKATSTTNVESEIPEFPTIALPVAAILGLAFFMQRRKEE